MNLSHNVLEELVNNFKAVRFSWKLLLNIRCSEDILKIDPLLLAKNPLFYDLS